MSEVSIPTGALVCILLGAGIWAAGGGGLWAMIVLLAGYVVIVGADVEIARR
jgi:hypothetical protein